MTEHNSGYAVFLYEQALEVLGEAIKPHLHDGPGGQHVLCHEVDTAGAFVEMTVRSQNERGENSETELMVPGQMVRMIISARGDAAFGFAGPDRRRPALPVQGSAAPDAGAGSPVLPPEGAATSALAEVAPAGDDRRLPPEG